MRKKSKQSVKKDLRVTKFETQEDTIQLLKQISCFIKNNKKSLAGLNKKAVHKMFAADPIVIRLTQQIEKINPAKQKAAVTMNALLDQLK